MANYKIVELIIIEYLWSDVYSSYMLSSNPEYRWFCLCGAHVGEYIIHKNTS